VIIPRRCYDSAKIGRRRGVGFTGPSNLGGMVWHRMTTPFTRVLVPFDDSEPANVALDYAIELGRAGAGIVLANVVDETPLITQSATTVAVYDPTPMMEALDAQARAVLAEAEARCRAAQLDPVVVLVHETPVAGIIGLVEKYECDLIAMGTHARTGVARMFLGSTTEGVLRASHVPVLAVRAVLRLEGTPLFRSVLVAVDDSEPSDAAVALAAKLARALGSEVTLCNVADTPDPAVVERAAIHAGLVPPPRTVVVEGEPAEAILAEAAPRGADLIVMGSHGRGGLQRLALGSVAEQVVRRSPVPVLVART
jgi:nucleotide-binding universal stress UspA family protein